jgi:hypothetical protein
MWVSEVPETLVVVTNMLMCWSHDVHHVKTVCMSIGWKVQHSCRRFSKMSCSIVLVHGACAYSLQSGLVYMSMGVCSCSMSRL